MQLLGKYMFERLRDCLQGVFGFAQDGQDYVVDLWQLRFRIIPKVMIIIYVNGGEQKGYIGIGKIDLS